MSKGDSTHGDSHGHKSGRKSRYRKKSKIIMILSGIISLFIAVCMVFILLSVLLKGGLLNEKLFRQTLSESTYYDNKINEIRQSVTEKLEQAGLPGEISDDVITSTIITLDVNKKLKNSESVVSDGMSKFGDVLKEKIYEYLEDTGIPVTAHVEKSVDMIVTEIARDYDTHMKFMFAKLYNQFSDKYADIFNIVIYVSAAVLIICSVVAVLLHSRKYRGLRYVGYGILAGSLVTEAISVIMKSNLKEMIPDKETEYYNVINTFIDKSFSQGIYMCLAGMLLFSLVSLMTYYLKKQVI